jgi:hypothetical protein
MYMLKMISAPTQAIANIRKFEFELAGSLELQARLAYARAWYAHSDESGEWYFAPSKFVGYQDIDAKTYLANTEHSDGRRTEAQLQTYFDVVNPENSLYAELNSALVAFLARYGKTPSTKARINVQRARRRLFLDNGLESEAGNPVVDLMVAVARTLPEGQFRHLLHKLEDICS